MRRGGPPSNLETANRLLQVMARKYYSALRGTVPLAELVSLGAPGAAKALRDYDGTGQFEGFALQQIKWSILRRLRRQILRDQDNETRDHGCALVGTECATDTFDRSPDEVDPSVRPRDLAMEAGWAYRLELAQAAEEAAEAQDVERKVELSRLRRAIAGLPPPEDLVLGRYCDADESFAEMAKSLGMSKSTVHDAYHRGVRRLEEMLGPQPDAEPEPLGVAPPQVGALRGIHDRATASETAP